MNGASSNNCTIEAGPGGRKLPLLLTNCSSRKRLVAAPPARLGSGPVGVEAWTARIAAACPRLRARDLYCGRAFREAARAADMLGADLWVASAGLGFVRADTHVPAYGATAAAGHPDSVPGDPRAWFARLVAEGPFPGTPDSAAAPIVLAALSGPYLAMLSPWLLALEESRPGALRLFTREVPPDLPRALRQAAMPYDGRLDDPSSGRPGTIGDFAQRALADFAEAVYPADPEGDPDTHAAEVRARLEGRTAPRRRAGRGASDEEVRALIRAHWQRVGGRSGRMLRVLRDDLGVACEQGRFKGLFKAVATEVGG